MTLTCFTQNFSSQMTPIKKEPKEEYSCRVYDDNSNIICPDCVTRTKRLQTENLKNQIFWFRQHRMVLNA
jgi:hypothetical protein